MEPELFADILTAWLKIEVPSKWNDEWLVRWLISPHSQPGDAEHILETVLLLGEELQQVFVERLNFSLSWAAKHPEVGPQLMRDLSILAKLSRQPMASAAIESNVALSLLPRRSSS